MNFTRKMLGAAAVAVGGAGLLSACAPTPAPVVPPTGPTSTKTFALTCNVYVPALGTSIPSTNNATITLTGADPTASGTGVDVTVDIDGGIKNGPLALNSGTVTAFTSLDGAAPVAIGTVSYGATAAQAFVDVPTISGTTDAVTADATVKLTSVSYTGAGSSGSASGTCGIAAGNQPSILIGVV